jgi:tetratricopeptide (TPR) repeat protein
MRLYNAGIKYLKIEEFGVALTYFDKAVSTDPKFVFAIDNLAVCYRKTGEPDKALATYDKSLTLSSKGRTALQNIPVIYELKKDYAKALEGYKKFLQYYPEGAEDITEWAEFQSHLQMIWKAVSITCAKLITST